MKDVNKHNFQEEVLQEEKPVLVEFWSSWCPPCKMMEPMLKDLAKEQDNVKICKINTDRNPQLTQKYKVLGVPTFILFKEGKEEDRKVAAQSKSSLKKWLDDLK